MLITWDIINYCKQNDIPTGAGRGSCCGSLVLFLIGVTEIDSVENGLFFERFLSKSRAKITLVDGVKYYDGGLLMDIDLDIGFSKRKLLTDWLENKYNGKISKLLTTSTYSTKILIKEVCKSYLDYNEDSASAISDLIPKLFGRTFTLEETLKDSKEFQKFASENPDAVNIGKNLHSLMSHFGVHASAWVITSEPINEIFPLQLTKERELVTSYSMEDASNLAIKCDILGLRCCTLIDETCKMIGLKPSDIDTKDEEIYKNLQNLESRHGIFQIEADLGFRTTQKVKPKDFNQLGAILALARPGSMAFADDYAEYSNNGKIPDFDIESDKLKKIMSETGGIIIYQETLMQIAKEVFGLSLDDAEQIRRACGKKKVEDMNKYKDIIYNKGQKLGIPKSAKFYWDVLIASADYSFNKCADISSLVEKSNGEKTMLKDVKIGDFIKAFDVKSNDDNYVEVVGIIQTKEFANGFPLIVNACFGIGDLTYSIPIEDQDQPISRCYQKKDQIFKKNGTPINIDYFNSNKYNIISGVLYTNKSVFDWVKVKCEDKKIQLL